MIDHILDWLFLDWHGGLLLGALTASTVMLVAAFLGWVGA